MKKEIVLKSLLKIVRNIVKFAFIFFEARSESAKRNSEKYKPTYVWSNIMKMYVVPGTTSDTQDY